MKKEKRSFGLSIGSSSILMVFVVLCLTTFATLSLVSANADYKLSRKTADAAATYYALDTAGERMLSDLADLLERTRPAQTQEETACRLALENALRDFDSPDLSEDCAALTVSEDDRWLISGTVCGADGWTLQIRLDVTERYWLNRENASIQRLLWQAVPPQEMQEESGMPVFQPGNLPVG